MIDSKCQILAVFSQALGHTLSMLLLFLAFGSSVVFAQNENEAPEEIPVFNENLAAAIEDETTDPPEESLSETNLSESSEVNVDDIEQIEQDVFDEEETNENLGAVNLVDTDSATILDETSAVQEEMEIATETLDEETQIEQPPLPAKTDDFPDAEQQPLPVVEIDEDSEIETSDGDNAAPLSKDIEDLKQAALELNRDLLILEEELLFPASTQVVLFLSMDVGNFFKLDSVKVSINDKVVATHLYTNRQNHALIKGGIQRLYMGNLKNGEHEVTAIFTGLGPDNREYKRGATTIIDKEDDLKMLELMIRDSEKNMQPDFKFKEWEL